MNSPRTFSRIGSQLDVNGERYQALQFVDICAAYGERLRTWRESALKEGMPAKRVAASMAVDVKPRDGDVHEMDVVDFLKELPAKSVNAMNGDWINVSVPGLERAYEAGGLERIIDDVRRVLVKNGVLHLTMPLDHHMEVMRIVREANLEIEPIAFGYVGFLGGPNKKHFPAEGLPPVAAESHFIRMKLAETKEKEEGDMNPLHQMFAEQIGTHAYTGVNPVRYRAVKKKN